jgi:hypothetical protein
MGRLGAATKAFVATGEQLAVAPITFPYQVLKSPKIALKGFWEITKFPIVHPLETAKGIGAITRGRVFIGEPHSYRFAKVLVNPTAMTKATAAIPARGTGVQRVFSDSLIAQGVSPKNADAIALEATRIMQLRLSDMIVRGDPIPRTVKVPVYENGKLKFTIEFDQTLVMRELGQAIHTTPFAERIFTGAAEPTPTRVYFSTAMSPEWTGVTARGYTTPEFIELGRGGAIMKDMRINRLFDPVSKTYRNTVELEMTTGEGTQLVTGRKAVLDILKAEGNVQIHQSKVMPMIEREDIVAALRAATGKQFKFRPLNFDEVASIPKGSAKDVETYVRTNDMMVGGSTAERTWTDTIKLPEDIDLISMKNNAKADAERLAELIKVSSGKETRVLDGRTFKSPKDVWRIEVMESGKWKQVTDVIDYSVHKTYNPDILNREPIKIEGIKVEHPLEQAERIVAKYGEYQAGEVPLERHRAHAKRLAWMAEKILDTPGDKLTLDNVETLNVVGARLDYGEIPASKLLKLKLGGLRDTIIDRIAETIPALRRGVRIKAPDGRVLEVPKSAADVLRAYFRNNPRATSKQIDEVVNRGIGRIVDETLARRIADGTYRATAERAADEFVRDPRVNDYYKRIGLRKPTRTELARTIDETEANEIYRLHRAGRFTVDDVRAMAYSGLLYAGTGRALVELARGDRTYYQAIERLLPTLPERLELPREPSRAIAPPRVPVAEILYRPYEPEGVTPERPREESPPEGTIPPEKPSEEPEKPPPPPPEEEPKVPEEPYEPPEEPYRPPEEEPYRPPEEPRIPFEPEKPPPPPPPPEREEEIDIERGRFPVGTVVWRQGLYWKAVPPPYDQSKPLTLPLGVEPEGITKRATGEGSAQKTLDVLGGVPPERIDIDMGVVDIHITPEDGQGVIFFKGGGIETKVGESLPSPTVGMTVRGSPLAEPEAEIRQTFVPDISTQGTIEKHGSASTYVRRPANVPVRKLTVDEFMAEKPSGIDSRLWRRFGTMQGGIERLGEEREEITPYGKKKVRPIKDILGISNEGISRLTSSEQFQKDGLSKRQRIDKRLAKKLGQMRQFDEDVAPEPNDIGWLRWVG